MPKIILEKPLNLDEVLSFAKEKHANQFRDDGSPYINHPLRVAKIISEVKPNSHNKDILIAAALLHDTLEDTYTSYKELEEKFTKEVASIVEELTTAPYVPRMIGKGLYLAQKMQYMTNYALLIKLADRYDNLCDLEHSTEDKKARTINDTIFILNYLNDKRKYTSSQQVLIDKIIKQIHVLETKKQVVNAHG